MRTERSAKCSLVYVLLVVLSLGCAARTDEQFPWWQGLEVSGQKDIVGFEYHLSNVAGHSMGDNLDVWVVSGDWWSYGSQEAALIYDVGGILWGKIRICGPRYPDGWGAPVFWSVEGSGKFQQGDLSGHYFAGSICHNNGEFKACPEFSARLARMGSSDEQRYYGGLLATMYPYLPWSIRVGYCCVVRDGKVLSRPYVAGQYGHWGVNDPFPPVLVMLEFEYDPEWEQDYGLYLLLHEIGLGIKVSYVKADYWADWEGVRLTVKWVR